MISAAVESTKTRATSADRKPVLTVNVIAQKPPLQVALPLGRANGLGFSSEAARRRNRSPRTRSERGRLTRDSRADRTAAQHDPRARPRQLQPRVRRTVSEVSAPTRVPAEPKRALRSASLGKDRARVRQGWRDAR